jgi:Zn-dependent protease
MQLDQSTLYALLAAGIMLLVGFPVHEFSHAWAAWRLGDSTARWQGRLTLNPVVHFDQVGGLMLLISAILSGGSWFFGYAKPTPVNPMNLREGRRGEAIVAAAGPLSNLVMAAIVAIPLRIILNDPRLIASLPGTAQDLVVFVPYYFVVINVFLFIFNLIPIPPLDGWKVLGGLVPPRTAWQMRELEQRYAMIIPLVFLAVVFLLGARIIGPIADTVINLLLGI